MGKSKLALILLVVLLLVSVTANMYLASQNLSLSSQALSDATKVEMNALLSAVQSNVDSEIGRIGDSVIYASQQLTATGISGDQARQIIAALAANSTFIIDAGTQDLDGVMVAVQPATYSGSIGVDVGEQKWLNTNPDGAITPMMTPVIPLIEGTTGVAMAAPVFNTNKQMIGTVSVIFNPQELVSACVAQTPGSANYEFTAMQTDGYTMFDSEPEYQGTNLLTNTTVPGYSLIYNSVRQTAEYISGYYLYDYEGTNWQTYWTTINAFGQNWRISVHHTA